jgi:hypothetical protein
MGLTPWVFVITISGKIHLNFGARVAQSVEQRTENPCVDGSIPPPGTSLRQGFGWQAGLSAKALAEAGVLAKAARSTVKLSRIQRQWMDEIYL